MSCFSAISSLLDSKPSHKDEKILSDSSSSVSTLVGSLGEKHDLKSLSSFDSSPTPTTKQLVALRSLLSSEGLTHYLVPSEDAHRSEYTSISDQRRSYISGFTGSAGQVIVSMDEAHLFVDGRYHVQATNQCDQNWTLHKLGLPGVVNWDEWIKNEAKGKEVKLGLDPALIDYTSAKDLISVLTPLKSSLIFPSRNLIDVIWGPSRPSPILSEIVQHPLKFSGQASQEKIGNLQKWLNEQESRIPKGSAFMITALDEVAWTLNLRGASIPNNPVFPSYLLIPSKGASTLFVSSELLVPEGEAFKYVTKDLGVQIKDYDEVWGFLRGGNWMSESNSIDEENPEEPSTKPKLVTSETASYAVINSVGDENSVIIKSSDSPLALAKACKNETELKGFRNSYLRDGAAWAKWAAWLEKEVKVKKSKISEYQAAEKFEEIRSKGDLYAGFDAYEAISASGPNAALPHYETPVKNSRIIDIKTPYLNDSGAQYFDGTIDTTRTVHFGKPTKEQKRSFTRVLQGHIAIDTAIFPENTTGATLDALARAPLWKDGCDYNHGTGHGVGSFLGVHEGPQGFSSSSGGAKTPAILKPGMCLSNEPGFYEEGSYGIRTESVLAVKEIKTRREFGGKKWYGFERFTQVPIDARLVDFSLMSPAEVSWLKSHNESVKAAVLPLVRDDRLAVKWLKRQ